MVICEPLLRQINVPKLELRLETAFKTKLLQACLRSIQRRWARFVWICRVMAYICNWGWGLDFFDDFWDAEWLIFNNYFILSFGKQRIQLVCWFFILQNFLRWFHFIIQLREGVLLLFLWFCFDFIVVIVKWSYLFFFKWCLFLRIFACFV